MAPTPSSQKPDLIVDIGQQKPKSLIEQQNKVKCNDTTEPTFVPHQKPCCCTIM